MAPLWTFCGFLVCWIILLAGQTFAGFREIAKTKNAYVSSGTRAEKAVDGDTVSYKYTLCIISGAEQTYAWWEVDLGILFSKQFIFILFSAEIARNKNTYVSFGGTRANEAVDGNTVSNDWTQCIFSGDKQTFSWWEVDLGTSYYIDHVKIYFRTDFKKRRNGVHVYTSKNRSQFNNGNLCASLSTAGGTVISDVTDISCNQFGRYVTIYQGTDNGPGAGYALDFCEVQVYIELDVSECTQQHSCNVNAVCKSISGSYTCTCRTGYDGDGYECTDVNECNQQHNQCDVNAVCKNTPGSYTCTCRNGYFDNGYQCTDVDECNQQNPCDVNAVCKNTPGSYTCTCRNGYFDNGYQCKDVNECYQKNQCDVNAVCNNTPGSYTCTCLNGYHGNGYQCTDINECNQQNPCDVNAVCKNTPGSYTCTCRNGYFDNGNQCKDVNECNQQNECDVNAVCNNTPGSYTCTCTNGYHGNGYQCTECEDGSKYGFGCGYRCVERHCLASSSCDKKTGTCVDGCKSGWLGSDCIQACSSSLYGPNCSLSCSARHCKDGQSCNHTSGECIDGCKTRWEGLDCTACKGGVTYGSNCDKFCGARHCFNNSTCDPNTGACDAGCETGWIDVDCTKACTEGWYGSNCSLKCANRHCKGQSGCNHTNGICDDGCESRWKHYDCTKCNRTYGFDCNLSCSERHCKDDRSPCDSQTGQCVGGCKSGWMNLTCTQKCTIDQYGDGCNHDCQKRHCYGNKTCDFERGQCINGCMAGWKGTSCIDKCSDGTYGMNCNSTCGSCKNELCNIFTGNCTDGCIDGFGGQFCMQHLASPPPQTGMIAGIVVVIIVVIILAVIVGIVLMRRRRMSKRETTDIKDAKDRKTKRMNSKAKQDDLDANIYVNVAMETRPIPEGTEVPEETKLVESSAKPVKISPGRVDVSAVKLNIDSPAEEVDDEENGVEEPGSVYCNVSDYNMPRGGIAISKLPAIIEEIRDQPGGFETEYKKLSCEFSSSYSESQIPENRTKNRFVGYYPYDNNRVTLTMLPDVPNSDYINASYMDAYAEKNYFIAAQAPNKKTLPDFWRMMWEKKCGHIIMLTRLVELTRNKCEPYWSDTKVLNTGSFKIALTEKEERSDFVYRKFCVTHKKSGQSKTFQQFHFMTWPDHGVPNIHDFLQFMWTVRNTKPTLPGPVLVHCSAGIGRTGTYIALDILLDEMEATGHVDIKKTITHMRDQRKGVVQTKDQYEMIFVGLLELSNLGNTTLTNVDFQHQYAKQKGSMSMGKKTVDELSQEVVALNDTPYEGSVEKYKVWAGGRHNLFAMRLPSKITKHGYLLTMHQNGTEESFWKLLIDNDSHTIISLGDKTDGDLIPKPAQSMTHGKTKITALRQTAIIHEITEKTLQVETKGHPEKQEIQHYCIHGWTSTIDSATLISCLTTMTEKIQEQQDKMSVHPVTVIYRESDAKNALTLCITNNIMTGIKLDKEVEIFNNTRRFEAVLPGVQLTKEDFAFFCNVAFVNLEASTMYANCPSTNT